jgi:hypothetical protein
MGPQFIIVKIYLITRKFWFMCFVLFRVHILGQVKDVMWFVALQIHCGFYVAVCGFSGVWGGGAVFFVDEYCGVID